ncbi:MAG TPA: DUF3800 domain-containing protein [Gemmatimonadaceae bacterium]|nr:DUF3800 domain-containing protein [Gemmatimonadaceae bacterium]
MAHFLFVDESGQDHRDSPYEVLAGVAVENQDVWNLVQDLHASEERHFGQRYSGNASELKAKKLLNRKVFRLARQMESIAPDDRSDLARQCLASGDHVTRVQLTALAQAKLAYVADVFDLCARFRCRVFASIINDPAPPPPGDYLRKDYAYLFERFFYFLEDADQSSMGAVVFDELERSKSHVLVGQLERYFVGTATGRQRAGRIIPEPFFVHSDLTTGIQLADLVAYILSWGFRSARLTVASREELTPFVRQVCRLRHRALRPREGREDFTVWSIAVIPHLRARGG